MEGSLIAFRLATYDRDKASELVERLVGQRTSSHGGAYVYRRKGLLDEIPHVRLIRGVVIVRTEDTDRVAKLLKGIGGEVHAAIRTWQRRSDRGSFSMSDLERAETWSTSPKLGFDLEGAPRDLAASKRVQFRSYTEPSDGSRRCGPMLGARAQLTGDDHGRRDARRGPVAFPG